jgi:hypothetical protein
VVDQQCRREIPLAASHFERTGGNAGHFHPNRTGLGGLRAGGAQPDAEDESQK